MLDENIKVGQVWRVENVLGFPNTFYVIKITYVNGEIVAVILDEKRKPITSTILDSSAYLLKHGTLSADKFNVWMKENG